MYRSRKILFVLLLALFLGFGLAGCKSKSETPKHRTLHGTITTIDAASKTVTMHWFNEKVGKTIPIAGRITEETEIYIDGKLGDITQMQTNDEVSVEGYKKGPDVIAVKIMITRTAGTKTISKPKLAPTTQPVK